MAQKMKPRPPCRRCGEPVRLPQQRYCSQFCMGQDRRKRVTVACAYCGQAEERRPSELGASDQHFCTHGHYVAWKRQQERPVHECAHCHQVKPVPAWANVETRKYCSVACLSAARRTSVDVQCLCGKTFTAEPNELRSGRGKYCSAPCRREGIRRNKTVEVACRRCGAARRIPRSQARVWRYCSAACRWGDGAGGAQTITCQRCRAPKRVPQSLLAAGWGKYCSRQCYSEVRKARRPQITCKRPGCRKRVVVSPIQIARNRQFCSRGCYRLSHKVRTFRCQTCRQEKTRDVWRTPRFCSRACANAGRDYHHPDSLEQRNRLILELAEQRMTAPQIARQMPAEWSLTPATVRTVLHRERQARERLVASRMG
jgi:hypothetical protein